MFSGKPTDFELRSEFWVTPDANSGIFIRCENPTEVSDQISIGGSGSGPMDELRWLVQ
jgi:hypothetical protein